jgi:predicted Zn-dependent peptidase
VELTAETRVAVEAGVELGRVVVAWPTPAFFAPGDSDLDLVARVLSSGGTSRLYKRLVYDAQIAQGVSARQVSQQLGSRFEISATAKPGHTPEELLATIDDELSKLRDAGATDVELSRARTGVLAPAAFDLEQVGRRADRINSYAHYAGEADYLPKDIARYEAATATSLRDAVRTWLVADGRVVVIVRPTKGAPVAGRLAGSAP